MLMKLRLSPFGSPSPLSNDFPDFVNENQNWNGNTNDDQNEFNERRRKYFRFDFDFRCLFHVSVKIRHQQNAKSRKVNENGSVILINIGKRSVHANINQEEQRKCQSDESAFRILCPHRSIKSDDQSIEDRQRNVKSANKTVLELVFKLSVSIWWGGFHCNCGKNN